jgi:hypothetical protein
MIYKDHNFPWCDICRIKDADNKKELDINNTEKIKDFFKSKEEYLKKNNKYLVVKETFLKNINIWEKEEFINFLWIKQVLHADSKDEDPYLLKEIDYQEKINAILDKMKGFFSDREKIQVFFIVTDGKKEPHILSSQGNSIFSKFKFEINEDELQNKTLIDFLNGESDNKKNISETTAEFIFLNDQWMNIYNKDDDRSLKFMPSKYKWLYLIRITKLLEYKNGGCRFEPQGLLGFYSTDDLSEDILPKQLLLLLRKDMCEFINKHHKNDEFSGLIQHRERNKYIIKLNHGVQTYENTIECIFDDKNKIDLEENIKTMLKYLTNKLHLISKLNSDNCRSLEKVSLEKIRDEFKNKYKLVFSLPMSTYNRIEKTDIDNIVQLNINFNNLDSEYYFPEYSYIDIIFEILLNIRKYGIGDKTFTPNDQMIINIAVENINYKRFLAIENTYKGDLTRFENLKNDDEPHGVNLLKQLWHSHSLGKINIMKPSRENEKFKLLIQLKEFKDEK